MQFRFLDIPVTIQPAFWLFLLFFCFGFGNLPQMFSLAVILGFSLLFHEYGHALAARKFGRSSEITLEAFGGYASYPGEGLSEGKQFIITLCGPLFTALLIALSYYCLKNQVFAQAYWPNYICYFTMKLNTYWLIVNLAPLQPLDGGKMLRSAMVKYWGGKGDLAALHVGNVVAVIGAIYFLLHQSYVFTLLFVSYGMQNFQACRVHPYRKRTLNAFAQLNEAIRLASEGNVQEARKVFGKLIRSKDPYIENHAVAGLAVLLTQEGQFEEVYRLLSDRDLTQLGDCGFLFYQAAYEVGKYAMVAEHSQQLYQEYPTLQTAVLNANVFARLGDLELSAGWMNTARQFEGFNSGELVLAQRE